MSVKFYSEEHKYVSVDESENIEESGILDKIRYINVL